MYFSWASGCAQIAQDPAGNLWGETGAKAKSWFPPQGWGKALLSHPALASPALWVQCPPLKRGYLIIAGYFKFRREEGGQKQRALKIKQCPFVYVFNMGILLPCSWLLWFKGTSGFKTNKEKRSCDPNIGKVEEMLRNESFPKLCHRQGGFRGSWGSIADLFVNYLEISGWKAGIELNKGWGWGAAGRRHGRGGLGKTKPRLSMEMCPVPGVPLLHNIHPDHREGTKPCTGAGIPLGRDWTSDWTFELQNR